MRRRWATVATVLAAMALAACAGDEGPDAEVGSSDTPLLTNSDLDDAPPVPGLAMTPGVRRSLTVPETLPTAANLQSGATLLPQGNPLADLFEPKGRIAYVQRFSIGRWYTTYFLRMATVRDFQLPGLLIYKGDRAIDSVAVSEDGKLVTFAAESDDGDHDVFLLDLDGSIYGEPRKVYALPSGDGDEVDVSMSNDGSVQVWQSVSETSDATNYMIGFLDRETGQIDVFPFDVTLAGVEIDQNDPSVSGDGNMVYWVADDQTTIDFFGAPLVVGFSLFGNVVIPYAGTPGFTEALANPSSSFDGSRVLFSEVADGSSSLLTAAPALGELAVVLADTEAEHAFLTADGTGFTFAAAGDIYKAVIDYDDLAATSPVRIPDFRGKFFHSSAPYWAKELPPPPPAPPAVSITSSLRVAQPGETIEFEIVATSDNAMTCEVDFGDGTVVPLAPCDSGVAQSVSHLYAADGFFTVEARATDVIGTGVGKEFPTIATDDPGKFDIVVVFADDQMSPAQRAAFQDAANRWSEVITGDLIPVAPGDPELPPDFSCLDEPAFNGFIDDLVISAAGVDIDGPGSILGQAGPCLVRADGTNGALFPLPIYGAMQFDLADLAGLEADGSLGAVILHEMGHVLGIGTLWGLNGFLTGTEAEGNDPADPAYDPRYIGPAGVAQYNVLLADASLPADTSVPAANTGGGGTREAHWREATFENEIMTGYLSPGFNPLSLLTIGDLEALGYAVDYLAADPYVLPDPAAANLRAAPERRVIDRVFGPVLPPYGR